MIYRTVPVPVPGIDSPASLTLYAPDLTHDVDPNRLRPAVIVCPGGGYRYTSDREAEPVALAFLARGMNVYLLRYHCAPEARYPIPQLELAQAIRTAREEGPSIRTRPGGIYVLGFSAGGHLAASLGILWKKADWASVLGLTPGEIRPDGMILCYPVITSGEKAHQDSFDTLLDHRRAELNDLVSLEKQVDGDTVPAFLWHTRDDGSVPVENSLLLASSLAKEGISFEMHIWPHGVHGLALANELTASPGQSCHLQPDCAAWVDLACDWIEKRS